MKRTLTQLFPALAISATLLTMPATVQAQCLDWLLPGAGQGWGDFNTMFGGAPCGTDGVCPVNEITEFEIYADEAYAMNNIQAGGSYTFSACNGTGGTAWDLYITIVAPSGAVDAFGLNPGSICALTWTASESGTYLIGISEAGHCGTSSNAEVANGFPAITCSGPATNCPPYCTVWSDPSATTGWIDFNNLFQGAPQADASGNCAVHEITSFEVYADEAYNIANIQEGTIYTFSTCGGTGGTAWELFFTVISPSGSVDAYGLDEGSTCQLTWTASESGAYLIVVSEAGHCGNSPNAGVDNGNPAITCGGAVSVNTIAGSEHVRLFPNPTNGLFTLDLTSVVLSDRAMLEVLDISGRVVLAERLTAKGLVQHMDLRAEPAGSYIVRVADQGRMLHSKLILMRD